MRAVLLVFGIVLIAGGTVSLVRGGLSFPHTTNEIDTPSVQISHTSRNTIPIAPIVSVVAILGGGTLLWMGFRSR